MFGIFKKKLDNKANLEVAKIKIDGMHCTSCSMSVDGELEDLDGVISASTSYAKQTTTIEYDPKKVAVSQIKSVITGLGYKVI